MTVLADSPIQYMTRLKDMYSEVVLHATAACLTRVKDIAAAIIRQLLGILEQAFAIKIKVRAADHSIRAK